MFLLWEKRGSMERNEEDVCAFKALWKLDFSHSCSSLKDASSSFIILLPSFELGLFDIVFVLYIISTDIENPIRHLIPFAFCFQTYFKDLEENNYYHCCCSSLFLNVQVSFWCHIHSEEFPLAVLLEQICW